MLIKTEGAPREGMLSDAGLASERWSSVHRLEKTVPAMTAFRGHRNEWFIMTKVLHLSTSDLEGGAARAAYRLHQGLKKCSADSQMLVRAKQSNDLSVIAESSLLTKMGPQLNNFPLRHYPNRDRAMFSPQWFPDQISFKVKQLNPDLINLHWICNGFLQIETLAKFNKPLVWTLHDMWSFTGGCHYTRECHRYKNSCGSCPQLKSNRDRDLSFKTWQRKHKAWRNNLNLTIVSPSKWLAECAHNSSLFQDTRIEVIPHGLDLKKYRPIEPATARTILDLPQDKQLILFGAVTGTSDRRKGFELLKAALRKLGQSSWQNEIELVVFGPANSDQLADLEFPIHCLGQFHDDLSLAIVYSAADVTVVPSTQEAFGQTASESLACATPVVAFGATGLLDIVEHQQDGYLAKPFEIEDLARGITWVIESPQRYHQLCDHAYHKAKGKFSLITQANRYLSLFEEIISQQK